MIKDHGSDEKLTTATGASRSFADALTRFQIAQNEAPHDHPDADHEFSIEPGTRVGDYEVLEKLGEGGMGVVLKAKDVSLGRYVAIKIISPSIAWNEQMVERFNREARAMASIDHENVMPILAWGRHSGLPYFAMPFTQGQTLHKLQLNSGGISTQLLRSIAQQTVTALAEIHDAGLIHRDLKPSNIWIESDSGQVKILDFGLVQAESSGKQLTQVGAFTGTPGYMAPEQVTGERTSPKTDIFSFGATLYFAICGRPPFVAKTPNAAAIATASLPFEQISKRRFNQPAGLIDLIHDCLHKDPDSRPSIAEVQDRLRTLAASRPRWQRHFTKQRLLLAVGTLTTSSILAVALPDLSQQNGLGGFVSSWLPGTNAAKPPSSADDVVLPEFNDSEIVQSLPSWLTGEQHHALSSRLDAARLLFAVRAFPNSSVARDAVVQNLVGGLPDPTIRTDLIHLGPSYLSFDQTLSLADENAGPDIRAAVLLMAAGFLDRTIHPSATENDDTIHLRKQRLGDAAMAAARTSPDAELQATCRWVLTTTSDDIAHLRDVDVPVPFDRDRLRAVWLGEKIGPPMVALMRPDLVMIGSPLSENGREGTDEDRMEDRRVATVPRNFAIAATEVTVNDILNILPSAVRGLNGTNTDAAIRQISWGEATEYCNRLSALAGMGPDDYCYETYQHDDMWFADPVDDSLNRMGYRLPTDDEWEFACRGSSQTSRFFGDDCAWLPRYASVGPMSDDRQTGVIHETARRKPNQFGLFDMLGNISEWTHDHVWISKIRHRSIRGGSVFTGFDGIRSAARYNINERMWPPHRRIGFRVARTLPGKPQ